MKKSVILILSVLLLGGCATLFDTMAHVTFSRGGSSSSSSEPQQNEPAEQPAVEPSGQTAPAGGGSSGGSDSGAYYNPAMQFSIYYGTYYALGAYGFGDDNFREGEGIRWTISTSDDSSTVDIVRARLKNPDSRRTWWFFSVEADGQEIFYEMLVEDNSHVVKVRYPGGEFTPDDNGSYGGGQVQTLGSDAYGSYKVGDDTVKTKAGSFKAEHLLIGGTGAGFKYEYWLADRVPGHVVKYRWENTEDHQFMTGEVVDIRGGYKTRLNSY